MVLAKNGRSTSDGGPLSGKGVVSWIQVPPPSSKLASSRFGERRSDGDAAREPTTDALPLEDFS